MPRQHQHVVRCPDCSSHIATDLGVGELIQCPDCDEVFRVVRGNIVPAGAAKPSFARVAIPAGAVLIVALAAGGVYWFATRDDGEEDDTTAGDVATKPKDRPAAGDAGPGFPPGFPDLGSLAPGLGETAPVTPPATSETADPPRPPSEAKPGGATEARAPGGVAEPGEPAGKSPEPRKSPESRDPPEPPAKKPDPAEPPAKKPEPPAPPAVAPSPREVAVLPEAPPPHDAPLIQEAPEPRELLWKIPPSVWESKWQTLGAVDLRVTNAAVTRYPLLTAKGVVEESKTPALAVVVEVRLNDPKRDRSLLGWTYGIARYGDAFLPDGRQLSARMFPTGAKVNHGLTFPVELPKDGTPVRDILLLDVPPAGTKEIELRLDGDRVREPGNTTFTLPAASWERKKP